MIAWFDKQEYDDYSDVAMACTTADATETKIINPMKASEIKTAKDDGVHVVRLRKFCQSQGKTLLFMPARENNHKNVQKGIHLDISFHQTESALRTWW